MDKSYYTNRMNDRLPMAMQKGEKTMALFNALDAETNLMEGGVKRLMHSLWYKQARGWFDPAENLSVKRNTELGVYLQQFEEIEFNRLTAHNILWE